MEQYIQHLKQSAIQFIKATPSYLVQLFSLEHSTWIKKCFVGGEKLASNHVALILKHVGALYDEYGPTEATVGALLAQRTESAEECLTMGRLYSNYKSYVLDNELNPVGEGVTGELYLGGRGLARGYLNQPLLTAECFISNPFETAADARLYKTGDLVRWLANGSMEFLGRNDFQVKIRGRRVELGEIEQVLLGHEHIHNAVVLVNQEEDGQHLLGFYQEATLCLKQQDIKAYLQQKLPDYMVPSVLLASPQVPLTANGKVDRLALLKLIAKKGGEGSNPSLNSTQQFVANLLKKIMHLSFNPAMEDNFFSLGGHSLLITAIIIEIRKSYACQIKPREIYSAKTLPAYAVD